MPSKRKEMSHRLTLRENTTGLRRRRRGRSEQGRRSGKWPGATEPNVIPEFLISIHSRSRCLRLSLAVTNIYRPRKNWMPECANRPLPTCLLSNSSKISPVHRLGSPMHMQAFTMQRATLLISVRSLFDGVHLSKNFSK